MTTTSIPLSRRRRLTGVLIAGFLALVVAAVGVFSAPSGTVPRKLASALGSLAIVSVVAFPILHGYYFFGLRDALSYLGWTRLTARERLDSIEFFSPGIDQYTTRVQSNGGIQIVHRRTERLYLHNMTPGGIA